MASVSLKEKAKQTIRTPFGEVPRWQDCKKCGAKLACRFEQYAHSQPCNACKNTPEYQNEESKGKGMSMSDAFKSREIASVWEGNGKTYFVNHKGNVIKEEKAKPLKVGDRKWR